MAFHISSIIRAIRRYIPQIGGTLVVDLGSSEIKMGIWHHSSWHTKIYPSLSVETIGHDIVVLGEEAKKMRGKLSDSTILVSPISDGEIAVQQTLEKLIREGVRNILLEHKKTRSFQFFRSIIFVMPADTTQVQLQVAEAVASAVGGIESFWIPAPIAHAWGAKMIHSDKSSGVLVDIGGETTEIAIIAHHQVVQSKRIFFGGENITQSIIRLVRKEHGLTIGYDQAEMIKHQLSFIQEQEEAGGKKKKKTGLESDKMILVKGRVTQSGLPTSMTFGQAQFQPVIDETVAELLSSIHQVVIDMPAEMEEEVIQTGIILVGGGSLIKGLSQILQQRLKIQIHSEATQILTAIDGVHLLLQNDDKRFFRSMRKA